MSEPFIGEIMMFGGNFVIRDWASCNGALVAINQNQALFALLGTTYGGDGRTTFGLPDLRGRVPMGIGRGPGLTDRRIGQLVGSEYNQLIEAQLPPLAVTATGAVAAQTVSATATLFAEKGGANASNPKGNLLANDTSGNVYKAPDGTKANNAMSSEAIVINDITIPGATVTVSGTTAGGSAQIDNMQPSLVVNFLIALQGVFPSRN